MSWSADDLPALRRVSRDELGVLVDWAAAEGWNPGLGDADVFWATDPDAFVGLHDDDGELIASGSIVSYGGAFGILGLFIVRPELRGKGLGRALWARLEDELLERLEPGAAIGIDGVFAMQDFYASTGFRFSHRNLRMEGVGAPAADTLTPLSDLPFGEIVAFDRVHFGADRGAFLRGWIDPPGGRGVGLVADGALRGIGVVRPCRDGYKIGPLFALDRAAAEQIFAALSDVAVGAPLFLDVPENNPAAVALAARHRMTEVFGCARMYLGTPPPMPWKRIFGVTTLELG